MKIAIIFGTRPEIIRLSAVIKTLDGVCDLTLVHTGQNYDPGLSDIFFQELGLRPPDVSLGIRETSVLHQVGQVIAKTGDLLERLRPDRVLILGDTNSGLAAVAAARLRIPVFHMEAGNRCYDDRVPEEINRRIIDHSSNVLMPYTHRSKDNLVREGIARDRIFVVGNPILEVIEANAGPVESSQVLDRFGVTAGKYFLATMHRAENVDQPERLSHLVDGLSRVAERYQEPLIVSTHPRTADRIRQTATVAASPRVKFVEPMGFFDFIRLEKTAHCVISDSGTVQEECCLFHVPSVTIRDVTERAETIEVGSNLLSGADPEALLRAVSLAINLPTDWVPPAEYRERHVSTAVAKVLLGFHRGL